MTKSNRKLNQVVAIEKGVKSKAAENLTGHYHTLQKPALLSGISRTYVPKHEDGDQLPAESTKVQVKVHEILGEVSTTLTRLFDVTATKEWGNTHAASNVTVDGKAILSAVPVSYLLFLEKQLVDVRTLVSKLPTLDPAEHWAYDEYNGIYQTAATQTLKTKKVLKNHVKAEATDKHPAQVDTYTEDVPVGTWTTVKTSGAVPQTMVKEYLQRVEQLLTAVKEAREHANSIEVSDVEVGEAVFTYLFG